MGLFDMSLYPSSDSEYEEFVALSDPKPSVKGKIGYTTKYPAKGALPIEAGGQYQIFYNLVLGPNGVTKASQEAPQFALSPAPEATERKLKKVE